MSLKSITNIKKLTIMKKLTIKLFAVIILCFIQTTAMAQTMKTIVEAFNILCPYDIGSGCSIKGLAMSDEYVEMTFIINEKIITVKDFEKDKDTYSGTMARSFAEDKSSKTLIEQMADEGYGLKLIIIGDISKDQCEIPISNQQLKEALSTTREDIDADQLTLSVVNSSHKLPVTRGIATLEDISMEDGTVTFFYNFPEEMVKQAADSIDSVIDQEFDFAVSDYFEKKMFLLIMENQLNTVFRFGYGKKKKILQEMMLSAREVGNRLDKAGQKHDKEIEVFLSLMKLGSSGDNDTDVEIEGNDIVVTITVDDDMLSILSLVDDDDNNIVATDEMVQQTVARTANIVFFYKAIAASNKNLVYHYIGKESGKTSKCVIKNLSLVKALMNY